MENENLQAVVRWVQEIRSKVDDTPFSTKMAEESPELAELIGRYEMKFDTLLYELTDALKAKKGETQP